MFWRSLPGLKRIVRPGGMRTSFPVRGLRPMPRLRGFTWKTPNPRSSIRSPRCMEVRIASKTASTATSAFTLVMSAIFDTSLTMSTLIMLRVSWGLVNTIDIETYAVKAQAKLRSQNGQKTRFCCTGRPPERWKIHAFQPHDGQPPGYRRAGCRHDARCADSSGRMARDDVRPLRYRRSLRCE